MSVDVNGIAGEPPKNSREPMVTSSPILQGRLQAITSVDRGPAGPRRGPTNSRPDRTKSGSNNPGEGSPRTISTDRRRIHADLPDGSGGFSPGKAAGQKNRYETQADPEVLNGIDLAEITYRVPFPPLPLSASPELRF